MVAASGEQFEIRASGYRAVVTECGAGLRLLEYDGRPLLAGYPEDRHASAGRGQLLLPWPNRIRDGAYTFADRDLQLPVTEVARGNAIHGLTRWAPWTLEERTDHSVSLLHRLMARPGYPWTLDVHALYDLSADGLTATVTATNLARTAAPYAHGAHPYLSLGEDGVAGWELTLPAATSLTVDERMIPVGREPVAGTDRDFRTPRRIGTTVLDTTFTDLDRTPAGQVEVGLRDPATGRAVTLWMDRRHRWVQLYTGDDLPTDVRRRAVAVEPMSAPPDAFRSGEDLVVLAAAGSDGDEHSASWGIRAD